MLPGSKALLTIACILYCGSAQSQADVINGNTLLANCTANLETEFVKVAYCAGYINGVNEGMIAGSLVPFYRMESPPKTTEEANVLTQSMLGYCLSEGVEIGQMRDVVIKYLNDNPAERHYPARLLILNAFQISFPCS